jgi:hypothetical protein
MQAARLSLQALGALLCATQVIMTQPAGRPRLCYAALCYAARQNLRFRASHLTICYSRRIHRLTVCPCSCTHARETRQSFASEVHSTRIATPITLAAATTAMCCSGGSSAGGAQVASASTHCSRSADGQMMSSGQSSG